MNKGKLAIMVLSKGSKGGDDAKGVDHGPDQDEEAGEDVGLDAVAQDLIDAVQSKDPAGVAEAIKAAVKLCMDEYSGEEEGEEPSDEE